MARSLAHQAAASGNLSERKVDLRSSKSHGGASSAFSAAAWSQEPGVRSQGSGVRGQGTGARGLGS